MERSVDSVRRADPRGGRGPRHVTQRRLRGVTKTLPGEPRGDGGGGGERGSPSWEGSRPWAPSAEAEEESPGEESPLWGSLSTYETIQKAGISNTKDSKVRRVGGGGGGRRRRLPGPGRTAELCGAVRRALGGPTLLWRGAGHPRGAPLARSTECAQDGAALPVTSAPFERLR